MPREEGMQKSGVGGAERQTGRASAFAQASGLEASSPVGARVRKVLVAFALMLVAGAAIGYYSQSLKSLGARGSERNLVTPAEQSVHHIREGKEALLESRTDDAIASFREAVSLTPDYSPAYIALGQAYEAAGRDDEAVKTYNLAVRKDSLNIDARFQLAEIYRGRGNWRDAYQEYQRIIAIDPMSLQAYAALTTIERYEDPRSQLKRTTPLTRQLTIAGGMASLLPQARWDSTPLAPVPAQSSARLLGAPPTLFADTGGSARKQALAAHYKESGMRLYNRKKYQRGDRRIESGAAYES